MQGTLNIAAVLLLMTMIIGGMTFGSKVESMLYPVLQEIVIEDSVYQDQVYTFVGHLNKIRPECIPLVVSFWEERNGRLIPLTVNFDPDDFSLGTSDQLRTRPAGDQQFGPWQFLGYSGKGRIVMKTLHDCHLLWNVTGEYYLEEDKNASNRQILQPE